MATSTDKLARLLQLASPALPVGAYSYSGGLEAAIEAGAVTDAASAERWIGEVLAHSVARMEAPVMLRLCAAWRTGDRMAVEHWNRLFLASRETSELRAETVQMGFALEKLLDSLCVVPAKAKTQDDEVAFPAAFARAAAAWDIDADAALTAYLWAWLESQVLAAVKAIPLGQTEGQKMLLALGARIDATAAAARALEDDELGAFAPRLAILSARHETQYSRLFRS
jgi:urease accessory protein